MGFSLLNCKIILDTFDLSGFSNSISIERSQEPLANDTFDSAKTVKSRIGGLSDGMVSMNGLVDLTAAGQDAVLSGQMGLSDTPVLVSLIDTVDFARCKFGVFQNGNYDSGGSVGEIAKWSASGRISSHALVEGNIMAVGAKTGTFDGTARQIGPVSATQKLYAQIHATAKDTFTSAVFKVQTASDEAFTTPNDRITFTTITDLTSEFATPVDGAITDEWVRVSCTAFTGTSLTVHVAVGIW